MILNRNTIIPRPIIKTAKEPPLPKLRNKQPAVDLAGFFDLVQQAFKIHVATVGTPEGVVPELVESFPLERLSQPDTPFNIITYRIKSSTMAASTNEGNKPRGLTLREIKQSDEKSDYNIEVNAWREQVVVVFEIWCKNNADANTLVIWFHKFIFTWAFILKYFEGRGVSTSILSSD